MARARLLKPGFFLNEKLGELSPLTRLLFAGLWGLADREGRLKDEPKKIKAQVLPYDHCNVVPMLLQLESSGFVKRYTIGDSSYIQIRNFLTHQHPNLKEPASTIPACESTCLSGAGSPVALNGSPLTVAVAEAVAVSEQPQQLESSLREGSNIFRLYEDLCGTLTPHMADVLRAAETEYPPGWIAPAFEEASEANVRKWKYVEAILKKWSESGFPFEEDDDDGDDEQESENWYEKAKERARERLALEARSGTYAGPTL